MRANRQAQARRSSHPRHRGAISSATPRLGRATRTVSSPSVIEVDAVPAAFVGDRMSVKKWSSFFWSSFSGALLAFLIHLIIVHTRIAFPQRELPVVGWLGGHLVFGVIDGEPTTLPCRLR
jgi:hypothetical protein